jgi:tetratricopeptide (TPR) repeat protein
MPTPDSSSPSSPRSAPRSASRRQFSILCIGFLLLAAGIWGWWSQREAQVDRASPGYRDAVSAFYIGLSALQVGENDRAGQWLSRSTELAPDEPATWANQGVFFARTNEFSKAGEALGKARELAPQSSHVSELMGALAAAQGDSPVAVAHFERAVQQEPSNLRARYALAQELQRSGEPGGEKRALEQVGAIVQAQPENLVAAVEALRLAAKTGDAATFKAQLAQLEKQSSAWDEAARQQLREVQALDGNPSAAAVPVVFLSNILKPEPLYKASLGALANEGGELGRPFERFVKWPLPDPAPSAPDTALKFTSAPAQGGQGALEHRALWPTSEGAPLLPTARLRQVRLGQRSLTLKNAPPSTSTRAATAPKLAFLDWNNDFQNDVIVAGNGVELFQGTASTWKDVTSAAKLPADLQKTLFAGAWPADIESDGDLDVVLAPSNGPVRTLRNNGDGTWTPVPLWSEVSDARGFAWADWDRDGDGDAALLNASGALSLFANDRSGRFRLWTLPPNLPPLAAIAAGDAGNRGVLDLAALAQDGRLLRLFWDEASGAWQSVEVADDKANYKPGTSRLFLADLDNNGGLDVVASSSEASAKASARVMLAGATGRLEPQPSAIEAAITDIADVDGDGRLDLLGLDDKGAVTLKNSGQLRHHWVSMRPRGAAGEGDNRINSFGIGGQIEARSGLLLQIQPIERPVVHFGLGERLAADVARIGWPDGTLQGEFEFKSDQSFLAEQRLKGSCPYLWAWDGQKMTFVKDCNWRSPLGLKINAQDTAGVVQTADWVKVDGKYLQPRLGEDGKPFLDLRISADLWETHFFDEVALLAVDRPRNTQIWVDERFSIPMPPLQVLATGPLQSVRARDEKGRDVTASVAQIDGRYLDTFALGRYQGVASDHWAEIDLSSAPARDTVLICSGWLYPTDSSINVALGQGRAQGPQGLSLEVPDGRGGWRVARAGLGFPAGKNKTITLDLNGVLPASGPRKIRLRTNLEIFWDRIGWAQRSSAPIKTTRLGPQDAALQFRGITRIEAAERSSPELPLGYEQIERAAPRWRDLEGFHTRWGDVKSLVTRVDDRYVLMNAGDEMRLRVSPPPAPPQGWERDWVFISDGWTKDGNLNTTDGQTVLPLPAHDRKDYSSTGRLQDDPVYKRHRGDWRTYHTRYVRPRVADALRVQ